MVLMVILSFFTYIIHPPPNCEYCSEVFPQMGAVLMFKFFYAIR